MRHGKQTQRENESVNKLSEENPSVSAYFDEVKYLLITEPSIGSFDILREVVKEKEGFIRIRAMLSNKGILEIFEYVTIDREEPVVNTYSFHWQDGRGNLLSRWDNAPHHKEVTSFPHHRHLENGVVSSKQVTLKEVLEIIQEEMSQ
ncbi:hypothetical protein HKBW3S42_00492 [Candidatus Hakubella thermalkaliphila]|uniref:Uncharacterized protein n=1 Tax=Candidatus Hakubella thermalkaliphila TaxID=2754717 RepID=A0A6V8PIX8_9ACTN|nr:hypothetical protein HKBW3S09_00780 [Candidatus Hakubella thermalkaliphila]GFP32187.1 hypothetical protein HKBW3S42_00492 [Candidatus Hakubella thermalkaliphila]